MRLKLDLHPIYNDSRAIEDSLARIIEEAVEKRASEVEVIPGKGSGALKKTVLRFLDRPDVKSKYHRIEKDSDNSGRLFIHFRYAAEMPTAKTVTTLARAEYICFCCRETIEFKGRNADMDTIETVVCPSCGSPNRVTRRVFRSGLWKLAAENGYA